MRTLWDIGTPAHPRSLCPRRDNCPRPQPHTLSGMISVSGFRHTLDRCKSIVTRQRTPSRDRERDGVAAKYPRFTCIATLQSLIALSFHGRTGIKSRVDPRPPPRSEALTSRGRATERGLRTARNGSSQRRRVPRRRRTYMNISNVTRGGQDDSRYADVNIERRFPVRRPILRLSPIVISSGNRLRAFSLGRRAGERASESLALATTSRSILRATCICN